MRPGDIFLVCLFACFLLQRGVGWLASRRKWRVKLSAEAGVTNNSLSHSKGYKHITALAARFVCFQPPGFTMLKQLCKPRIMFSLLSPHILTFSCMLKLICGVKRSDMIHPNNYQPISVFPVAFEITLKGVVQVQWISYSRDHNIFFPYQVL